MAEILLREVFKTFDKAYFAKKPSQSDFEYFCEKAKDYAEKVNKAIRENKIEENFKLDFASLLKETFYVKRKDCDIEPANQIDMAILKDDTIRVLMEFKRFSNKAEMIRKNDLNRKALHEALTYFFDQFYNKNNRQIRSIIISNGEDFFIFDPKEFTQRSLEKIGKAAVSEELFNNKTDFIYDSFKQVIAKENITFNYSYFNSHDLSKGSVAKKIVIYKTLHPDFLLREYSHRDSNQLNKRFYVELLHILGLSEITKDGKVLIQPSQNKQGLVNETIEQLATDKGIYELKEAYEIAFELVITWLNRVLFLKLFESQLVSFNNGDPQYRFLTASKIGNYDALNNLFFKVLGRPVAERAGNTLSQIPYLNSSLFEVSEAEKKYFSISSLDNGAETELYKSSNLKKWSEYKKIHKVSTLKYWLDFLESYDFSSVDDGDLLTKNSAEIINPAVLGLIFEKLNGYKEGSFFTPGYITEFMSELSIKRAVIQKFNSALNIEAENIDEICNCIGSPVYKTADLKRYNELVDSLKIVDPAVGSGHFLVSALNYIIYLKSKLGILWDGEKRITEEIEIVDDTLCVYIEDQLFAYKRNDPRTYRLQKALFKEKQKIIENCLFGVDINEKSVTICQLRLWIELLKNAYYLDKNSDEMELLPNIDINIKANNSLISKYKPAPGKSITKSGEMKKVQDAITSYKKSVNIYKHSGDKKEKNKIKQDIVQIKSHLYRWVQQDLFSDVLKENHDFIYKKAMEWLIEFPELLDENGKFQGFDLVIGNPPYIKEPGNKAIFEPLKYDPLYQGKMDIWYFFVSRGLDLIHTDGLICYIAQNNWITSAGASKLRNDVLERAKLLNFIDFNDYMVFESASIQTMIVLMKKRSDICYKLDYSKVITPKLTQKDISNFLKGYFVNENNSEIERNIVTIDRDELQGKLWTFVADGPIKDLLLKIQQQGTYFLNKKELKQGIVFPQDRLNKKNCETLGNGHIVGEPIFLLTTKELENLQLSDSEKSLIRPFYMTEDLMPFDHKKNKNWIIYTTSKFNSSNSLDKFPKIKKHLEPYLPIFTSDFKPYGLHRSREEAFFEGEKILVQRKCVEKPIFYYFKGSSYVSQTFNVIKTDQFDNKFLTALLNSNVVHFWLKHKGKRQGLNYQIDAVPLMQIPLTSNPDIEDEVLSFIRQYQQNIISYEELMNKVNSLIYKLYCLTSNEIQIIESELLEN